MNQAHATLREAVARGDIPGVVAAATNARETIDHFAAGKRALPDGAPMGMDTVFRIASMTKAITATAAMQLVEQGKLALDAPAADTLAELRAIQVLDGFDADGTPRLRPPRSKLTLRQLLTHTAGFGYETWNPMLGAYAKARDVPPARTGKLAALAMPLAFDPGTDWQYGINLDWVGRMVEAASGLDLETCFRRNVLDPLGMDDTSFLVSPAMEARLATVHARDGAALTPIAATINAPREFHGGGGGLYSTPADYLRFLRMMLGGGALDGVRVLAAETVAVMGQNHIGALAVRPMVSAMPALSNTFEAFPGMVKKWGLSFLINTEDNPGGRRAGSLAWAGLNNTYFWIDPTAGVAGLVMAQLLPFGDGAVLRLLEAYEQGVYRMV